MADTTRLIALRGATTVKQHTKLAYKEALLELLNTMMKGNQLTGKDIVAVWFTVTQDLTCDNPARIARTTLADWTNVPMLCGVEPDIDGFPKQCVRVMIQAYLPVSSLNGNSPPLPFCYQGECKDLRK